jgi:hypothetical protein
MPIENIKSDKPPVPGLVTVPEPRDAIDLNEYTPLFRRHLKKVGACAVYVVGESDKGPMKVGIAGDVKYRVMWLQNANLGDLKAYYVIWTPGRPVASRIESYTHGLLARAGRWVRGEWFDVDAESTVTTVNWAAREMYPNASLFSHREMIGHLRRIYPTKKKVDAFPQINDKSVLAEMFGSASSDPANHKPKQFDVAMIIHDDLERRIDPEGFNARRASELERFRASKRAKG